MDKLYYSTKELYKDNKDNFNLFKNKVNGMDDKSLLSIISHEIGTLVILSQSAEFFLDFTDKFNEAITEDLTLKEIKTYLKNVLNSSQEIIYREVRASKLHTLIQNAIEEASYDVKSLKLLDELRINRNYYTHNFIFNNYIDYISNSSFKKKTAKIIGLTNILMSQLIHDLYTQFEQKISKRDKEIVDLFTELRLSVVNKTL